MTQEKDQFVVEVTAKSAEPYKEAELRDEHTVYSDEPEWTAMPGDDEYPSPGDYLLLSLAACQVSVLDQCLKKNDVETYEINCTAEIDKWGMDSSVPEAMPETTGLRVEHITVDIVLETTAEYEERASRCLEVFDEGCVVGQSIGIDYQSIGELKITEF